MRIAIDLHGLGGPGTGLTRYAQGLLRYWLADPRHAYRIFAPAADRACYVDLPSGAGIRWHWSGSWSTRALSDLAWHHTAFPLALQGCAVLFTAVDRRLLAWSPIPVVGTVHDLAPFALAEKYGASRDAFNRRVLPALIRRADHLIAVSQATADDLVRHLALGPGRVSVVPNGIEAGRFATCAAATVAAVRQRLGLTRPFVLYPGRLEHPGKNHVAAIAACVAAGVDLVCVGRPWMQVEVIQAAAAAHPERIHLIGWLPDDDLVALYHGATALLFTSRHEGFGLPVLEAFAAGLPVVCSRVTALVEVAGVAALTAEPDDVAGFAAHLATLREQPQRAAELIALGRQRLERFSWRQAATATLAVLERAAAAE
jgi:glycosyltransferase involved in cell wall biosynthesis